MTQKTVTIEDRAEKIRGKLALLNASICERVRLNKAEDQLIKEIQEETDALKELQGSTGDVVVPPSQ
jgi:hypothetical protein